ncbi:hypothetical protein H109_01456 [Trichophyton interdigitale MR816]|nr:hypothetical protein H101_01331 [Trichophyton interdigitale H6]KDB26779.1 hypothetical protein H109_01456 [Trichophyton interdigitale MR816]
MVRKENQRRSLAKEDAIKPFHDKKAGVKTTRKRSNKKKEFAAELGLGGYLIWAIDQDDDQRSALQAILSPKSLGTFKHAAKDASYYEVSFEYFCAKTSRVIT